MEKKIKLLHILFINTNSSPKLMVSYLIQYHIVDPAVIVISAPFWIVNHFSAIQFRI